METKTMLICNADDTTLIESSSFPSIYDENSYERLLLNNELQDITRFIIVAELNWNNKNYSDFYGLDLIKRLRIKSHSKASILVISHYPYDMMDIELLKYAPGNQRYFRDPAVSYMPFIEFEQLPLTNSLDDLFHEPLDDKLHYDLKETLYSDYGFLNEEICAIYDNTYEISENNHTIKAVDNFFNKALNTSPLFEQEICTIKNVVYSNVETLPVLSRNEMLKILPEIREELTSIIPQSDDYKAHSTTLKEKSLGKVLYVDSNELFGKKIKNKLIEEGIKCQLAFSVEEAIQILKDDNHNDITSLVCDYRFLNSKKQYHRKQAYHLSEELAELPNMVNMIVLNGLNPSTLSMTSILHERMVVPMQKREVFDSEHGLDKLCSIVKKLNLDALEKINGFNAFNNTQTHKALYKTHRESSDYQISENDISETARLFVTQIVRNGFIPKYLLPNLSGRLNNKNLSRDLSNFRDVMVGRRFILGLCQLPYKTIMGFEKEINRHAGLDKKDWWYVMYNAIKNGELKMNHDQVEDTELHNVINRNLKMSIKKNYNWQVNKSFPLTVEEKKWLNKFSEEFANLKLPE